MSEGNQQSNNQRRQFICACGKGYLSNASLFLHVKLKHNGKAPGQVKKPLYFYNKRGRPDKKAQRQKQKILNANEQNVQINQQSKTPTTPNEFQNLQRFQTLFEFMKEITVKQPIDQKLWSQLRSYIKIKSYIKPQFGRNQILIQKEWIYYGVQMGLGISEFLKLICLRLQEHQFEQILLLLIFLVEYIFNQNNRDDLLQQSPVEFLFQYTQSFINYQLENCKLDYQLQHLWIMRRQNCIKVLYCLKNWLIFKKYAQDIQIIDDIDDFLL